VAQRNNRHCASVEGPHISAVAEEEGEDRRHVVPQPQFDRDSGESVHLKKSGEISSQIKKCLNLSAGEGGGAPVRS